MLFQCQKLLKNRKCLNFLMFLQGAPRQVHPWAGTPPPTQQVHPRAGTAPQAGTPPRQVHPQGRYTPWAGTAPGAVHAERYGQQVGGMHITGMHFC